MNCDDCHVSDQLVGLSLVTADLGRGAFLAVLCDVCWHRRQYRADLLERLADRRAALTTTDEADADPP